MAWRIEPGEELHGAFTRLALKSIERARADLASSALSREQAVHRARRRYKKLRALLRLARPSLGASFAEQNRRWRDAGRSLAASRDATVLLATFDGIAARCPESLPANHLASLRKALARSVAAGAESGNPVDAAEVFVQPSAEDELCGLRWPRTGSELALGFRDSQERLRRSWKAACRNTDSETLHDWRKRVKDLASQLGFLGALLTPELKACRADAKAVAELIGEEHDLALLHDALAGDKPAAAARQTQTCLFELIEARRSELRQAAFDRGEALSSRSPKALARDILAIWQAADQPEPVSRRA